ncbi:cytochrome P450 [Streptomyces sp. JNUCC 63]
MTATADATGTHLIPDEIAKAAVLPDSYLDVEGIVYPAYAWLRANRPVGLARLDGYDPVWLVSKYADIVTVERRTDVFSVTQHQNTYNTQDSDAFMYSLTGGSRPIDDLTHMDPPEHTKVRNVVGPQFTPRHIARLELQIREHARAAVKRLLTIDGELNLVEQLSKYPLHVIMTLLGVPEEDEPLMLKLTQEFFGASDEELNARGNADPETAAAAFMESAMAFNSYFNELSAKRRAKPADDLATLIANSRIDGEPISDGYANGWYIAVAAGGHDTTTSSILHGLHQLALHPDLLDEVRSDLSLIPGLVEESFRWATPAKHFLRTAKEDIELGGAPVKKGDRVMVLWASGNRDEEVFQNPDTFDIRRTTRHLAFGSGIHTCVGMHLAKLEMRVLFEELIPQMKRLEIVGEPTMVRTNFVGGFKSLPVQVTGSAS